MINERLEQKFKKDFFKLAVLTIITTVVWLGMVTYKAFTKSQVKPEVKKLLTPLTPTLDLDTMKKIDEKEVVPAVNWDSINPARLEVLSVPLSSPSADEASPSAEASPSGKTE